MVERTTRGRWLVDTMIVVGLVLLAFLVPATGGLLAATPWLMRRNECFAVTVPAGKQNDPRLMALKRSYTKTMVMVTVLFSLVAGAPIVLALLEGAGSATVNEALFTTCLLVGVLAPLLVSFALMLKYRRQVQAIKVQERWFAERQQAVALVVEEDVPRPLSLAWNLLYVPVLLVAVGLALALYPLMPEEIPMHWNLAGEVDSVMPKGPGVIGFPALLTVFMAACMTFSHWSILRSKRPTDPKAPATSAFAYGMFARAQSIMLVVTGLAVTTVIAVGFLLLAAEVVAMEVFLAVTLAIVLLVVAANVAISVVYGQAGSRLYARIQGMSADGLQTFDDDEHWILGIFYYNRDDAALFLPERFGIGWTVNLARPAVWALIGGFVVLCVAFVAAIFVVTGA